MKSKITKTLTSLLSTLLLLSTLVGCAEGGIHFHSWSNATCTLPMMCECGESYGDPKGHKYTAATCTEASKCTRCGKTSGSSLGHTTVGTTNLCTEDQICSRCGVTVRSATGHNYSSASCTMAQTCLRCGESKGTALGHKFSDANCATPATCTRCGKTDGEALGHLYDEDICIRCGEIDPDTLPVNLENLHIIDSYDFSLKNFITDTYGNTYDTAFQYDGYTGYSVHNLNKAFSTFSGTIAVPQQGVGGTVYIYVDDKLTYTSEFITKESYKVDFSINVKNAQKIKIVAEKSSYYSYDSVIIVNAQLYK